MEAIQPWCQLDLTEVLTQILPSSFLLLLATTRLLLLLILSTRPESVSSVFAGVIMLAAVESGDVKILATLLHEACSGDSRSAVIPLLLAHPDIDVNARNKYGRPPFDSACSERASCVREMLRDSRVKVNEASSSWTPFYYAAGSGYLDVIRCWIASGRKIDLGKPGDIFITDAIGAASMNGETEVVTYWRDSRRIQRKPDIK